MEKLKIVLKLRKNYKLRWSVLKKSQEIEMKIKELASKFHEVYQEEAKRQGDIRHKDKYEDLPENIKDFDRALASYVLKNFVGREELNEAIEELEHLELSKNKKLIEQGLPSSERDRIYIQKGIGLGKNAVIKDLKEKVKV
jgi:hypothetical protein